MAFKLTVGTAAGWVTDHGLNPHGAELAVSDLSGGVSASVIAVTGSGVALVLKQPLPMLRVADVWNASVDRVATEVAALRLFSELTPGAVPLVLAYEPDDHVVALELLPASARNWQTEIAAQRVHPDAGVWAGATLGTWHAATAGQDALAEMFPSQDSFEQLRLAPYHETVQSRRPELADAINSYIAELRTIRRCVVDGDYAPKNMLIEPLGRRWVLDLEVAHIGNPVFDLAFFLSFVILSAVRWPALTGDLRVLAEHFLRSYALSAGDRFVSSTASIPGHTGCLVLARTDGSSPASFLDGDSLVQARSVGATLLTNPQEGLWSWS